MYKEKIFLEENIFPRRRPEKFSLNIFRGLITRSILNPDHPKLLIFSCSLHLCFEYRFHDHNSCCCHLLRVYRLVVACFSTRLVPHRWALLCIRPCYSFHLFILVCPLLLSLLPPLGHHSFFSFNHFFSLSPFLHFFFPFFFSFSSLLRRKPE